MIPMSLSKHLQVHCPASGTGAAVAEGVDVPLVAVYDTKVLKHQRNVWTVSHLSNLFVDNATNNVQRLDNKSTAHQKNSTGKTVTKVAALVPSAKHA